MKLFLIFLFIAIALHQPVDAKQKRSSAAKTAFKKANPCPATGRSHGRCEGWVIDHVIALCVGGKDHPSNMQWQTTADAKLKDKWECKGRLRR
jgi:hypothetical protein